MSNNKSIYVSKYLRIDCYFLALAFLLSSLLSFVGGVSFA